MTHRKWLSILVAVLVALTACATAAGASAGPGPQAHIATTTPPPAPPPDPPGTGNNKDPRRWPCLPLACAREAYRICKRLHACGTSPNNPSSGDARWRRQGAKVNWNAFGAAINASGDPLPGPRSLFSPHHIIPRADPRFAVAQLIAWRCGIRPHDGVNGVWLRGPRAKKGTPGYKSLSPPARKRVYHGDTFGLHYVYVVNKALLPAYNPVTHHCNRLVALHILSVLRGKLISGSPSFGTH